MVTLEIAQLIDSDGIIFEQMQIVPGDNYRTIVYQTNKKGKVSVYIFINREFVAIWDSKQTGIGRIEFSDPECFDKVALIVNNELRTR